MKAFHFSLESVLTLRQRQEKVAMGNYAQMLAAHRRALDQLEEVQQELKNSGEELREQIVAGCSASQAVQAHRYFESLERRRRKCVADVTAAEARKNSAMQAMLLARQQREVIDKFFEREKKRYDYACSREEQKLMDDLPQRRGDSVLSWNPARTLE